MTVANNDILRATGSFDIGRGTIAQQVLHYQYAGAGDTDTEVGDQIKIDFTDIYTNFEAVMDASLISTEIDVWLWDTVTNEFNGIFNDNWTDIAGILAGSALPNGTAFLLKILTTLPRRQGRKFVPCIGDSQYLDGGWTGAAISAAGLAIADIFTSVPTANGTLQAGVFNQIDESFLPFRNAGIINTFANYQRRRRPGVGI